MPRRTEDVVDGVRARAVSTSHYLRRIERAKSEGFITDLDAEQAYRGAFLSFHSIVENTIEYLFLGLLRGRVNHRLASVRPLISVRSDSVAIDVVFGGRKYADWLPYSDHTLRRSHRFFSGGMPFSSLNPSDRTDLDELTVLRNALAHESSHALTRFNRTFVHGKALLPPERRPAGYLRGNHAADQTRFEFLAARTARALQSLS